MKDSRLWTVVCCFGLFAAAACATKNEPEPSTETARPARAPANQYDPAAGTASVTGKILFDGVAPPPPAIRMSGDPVCLSLHKTPVYSEELLASNGRLSNVFVYVKEGLEKYSFAPRKEPATLAQQGCRFEPHVGGIMVNQDLRIVNNDPTVHNVRCVAEKNPQFNIGQPMQGAESVKRFAVPEVMIRFRCDVHKWMSSYMGVLPHPYFAVSGNDGVFALRNLPPGDYLIEAWHEKFGALNQRITVGDKEAKEITFTFKPAAGG